MTKSKTEQVMSHDRLHLDKKQERLGRKIGLIF